MRLAFAGMLVMGLSLGLVAGCEEPAEETVVQAPPQDEAPPIWPEEQRPDPEMRPTGATGSPPAAAPPVDTSVTTSSGSPTTSAQPLPRSSYASDQPITSRTYVVKAGDTLYKIAKKQYGDERKWRAIYEANRDTLKGDPDKLQVGMKLELP